MMSSLTTFNYHRVAQNDRAERSLYLERALH